MIDRWCRQHGKSAVFGGIAAAMMMCSLSGCDGKLSNGAHTVPTVKYRPDTVEVAATESSGSTAAASTDTAAPAGGVGTLKGRVVYDGTFAGLPPLYAKGTAPKDPSVCGAEAIPNESIVVNDGGLANVFIYLEKAPKGAVVPPVAGDLVFDQKTCFFQPHALVVRTKQVVMVLNDDAVSHNTHTHPKKNSEFNSIVLQNDRKGQALKYDVVEREPFQVGCDIHPWMVAYHLPLDHSFVALSKSDGTFEIKDLPSGKHEFKVWHEAGKMIEKALAVTIKPGDNEITIKVSPSKLGT